MPLPRMSKNNKNNNNNNNNNKKKKKKNGAETLTHAATAHE